MSIKKIQLAISAVMALGISCNATAENTMNMSSNIQGMEKCYGVVKSGLNDCGTAKHNCAGEAKQDGDKNEWVLMPTGLCKKLVGGNTG